MSRQAEVLEAVALALLEEIVVKERVCFKHLKLIGGKIRLRVKKLKVLVLHYRLSYIL